MVLFFWLLSGWAVSISTSLAQEISVSDDRSQPVFRLVAPEQMKAHVEAFIPILMEIYSDSGLAFAIHYRPLARSSMLANRGDFDGEVARIKDTNETYTNLIEINVPIAEINLHLMYRKDQEHIPKSIQELKSFSTVIPMGSIFQKRALRGGKIYETTKLENILAMLYRKRVRFSLISDYQYSSMPDDTLKNYANSIVFDPEILETQSVYHYIHVRHKKYLNVLEKNFQKARESGYFEQSHSPQRK
ncbi:MAG: hypothetical protein R3261_00460 [Alphaproteobacteria bacterium]|nr:hypothetical protein [Alphaproteobacteria bacterium]